MPHEPKPPVSSTEMDWIPFEGGPIEVYANVFLPNWSLSDVRLRLGQLVATGKRVDEGGFIVREVAGLTISWGNVKVLRDTLDALVKAYERINGEIKPVRMPTSF